MGLKTTTIQLERPIASVELQTIGSSTKPAVNSSSTIGNSVMGQSEVNGPAESTDLQNQSFVQVCQALQTAAIQLKSVQENIFKEHKEQIAKLSVEIARKVLMQKVQQGDYEIESIIEEALKHAPTPEDVVVHLNPEDLAQCQELQAESGNGFLSDIKLVSDVNIGRAQCRVESPKGIIESAIEENLESIGKALTKVK